MESLIEEIDFRCDEPIVQLKAPKIVLKVNELKNALSTTKKNKIIYREIFEETKKECPHPTLIMIYFGFKHLEKIENQRRKPRKRKGLKNKPKYSLNSLLK